VLFVGYQAAGTRGRKLLDGAADIRIHGQDVPVRCRVSKIDSMSAHADRSELLQWLGTMPSMPAQLVLVHGEPGPMDALKASVSERFGVPVLTPDHLHTITL
jgi:metallo-beta-lactamase family protein